jgi:hypothetical protein
MAPWLVAVIFIAVLIGIAWLVDRRARLRRKGLDSLSGPSSHADRVGEVERIEGGTTQRANDGFGGLPPRA